VQEYLNKLQNNDPPFKELNDIVERGDPQFKWHRYKPVKSQPLERCTEELTQVDGKQFMTDVIEVSNPKTPRAFSKLDC
jgi:hypothetical protein